MVENDNGTIRAVAWTELFPWLKIVRAFRTAVTFRALLLGALGILLTAVGWGVVGSIFGWDTDATDWLRPYTECPWKAVTNSSLVPNHPAILVAGDIAERETLAGAVANNPVAYVWAHLTAPATEGLSETGVPRRAVVAVLLSGVWAVAVWAIFGGAISRMAAVQLAADEQLGLMAALRFAICKWPSYFAAPLLPVGGVMLATIPLAALGLIMRADIGLLLAGILWPVVLIAALLMAMLLVGLLFGWPLMFATISTEGTDSFDALSRSYAYTFQRPLRYLFYVVVAGFLGWLSWIFVRNFAAGVVWLGYWTTGWGSGFPRVIDITNPPESLSIAGRFGALLIRFFAECVKLLAVGYLFSYFWSAATAVYFLLRRNVDATEMDEVYLDADASEETASLPPITTDAAGAPVVSDEAAKSGTEGEPAPSSGV